MIIGLPISERQNPDVDQGSERNLQPVFHEKLQRQPKPKSSLKISPETRFEAPSSLRTSPRDTMLS